MTTEIYTIKALDSYSWDMETCMESLNYALAYDKDNAVALCLMGRVQWEYFANAESAIEYYENALGANYAYAETYHHYIKLLIHLNRLDVAKRLVKFAATKHPYLKGTWLYYRALIQEAKGNWCKSLDCINKSLKAAKTDAEITTLVELKARVNKKKTA